MVEISDRIWREVFPTEPEGTPFVDEATGEVTVELVGACVSCPASDQTLKAGIERIMKDRVPGVTAVLNVGETVEASGTAVSL